MKDSPEKRVDREPNFHKEGGLKPNIAADVLARVRPRTKPER